jgi:hypothetical protein
MTYLTAPTVKLSWRVYLRIKHLKIWDFLLQQRRCARDAYHWRRRIFGPTCTRVPRNTSLSHIELPPLDLRGRMMNGLIHGLCQSTTLTSLDIGTCVTDRQGLTALGDALVENTRLPLEHIKLPECRANDDDTTRVFFSDVQNLFTH